MPSVCRPTTTQAHCTASISSMMEFPDAVEELATDGLVVDTTFLELL